MTRAIAHKIDKPTARAKLKPRATPYYVKVKPGHFLGYRVSATNPVGNWVAMVQLPGKQVTEPLGKFEDDADAQRYDMALAAALRWFAELNELGVGVHLTPSRVTLRQATVEYVAWCLTADAVPNKKADAEAKRARKSRDADLVFVNFVLDYKDRNGKRWIDRELMDLRPVDWQEWRAWLENQPSKKPADGSLLKSKTVGRYMSTLRAALNRARAKHVGSNGGPVIPHTWEAALESPEDHKADNVAPEDRRERDVSRETRATILAAARKVNPQFALFLEAHYRAPVRPGGFASMLMKDWHANTGRLWVRDDKTNGQRWITFERDAGLLAFMKAATRSKLPAAPLFTDADGNAWNSKTWDAAIKECCAAAGIDEALGMYDMRHSRITDLVEAGELSIGAIAKLAGTSVEHIERTYYHLRDDTSRKALAVAGGF